jgi:hypothetical protein
VDPSGANWLGDQMRLVGQGLYDMMMGDSAGKYDPNSLGALDAQMGVMDIDRNNNVLRDSMGAALGAVGAIGQEIATAYAGGKAAEAALGVAGAAACKAKPLLQGLGDALPTVAKAAGEGADLAAEELPQLEISASRYPDLAENIFNAQKAGHPQVLTAGGDVAANRAAALEGVPNISGLSRDEYPFASSMEGGQGAWVGHIPAAQQNAQGGLISRFLIQNNLSTGSKYRVVIVP